MKRPLRPVRHLARRTAGGVAASLALTLGLALVPAAASAAAAPDRDGIRDRQLDRLVERVHDLGAVGVTGELVTPDGRWRGAAGQADRDPRRAAGPDSQFRAASVSKQLVSVLALQQVEQGGWSLDTTLGDVVPRVWPERSDTTLRQLLSHTSGIPEYLTALAGEADTTEKFLDAISLRRTDRDLVTAAKSLPATAEPGEFSYANTNFVLVGMMLAKATGRPVAELVERRVLAPARMTQSSWPRTPRLPRAALTEYGRLYGEVVDLSSFEPSMFSSAGALVTSARDLDRFQLALSRGRLVSRDLVGEMRTVVSDGGETGLEYGLGSYRVPDPCRPGRYLHGHDGGSWGTFTLSFASPRGDRRATVAMTGRDYDGTIDAVVALNRLVVLALAQTCGGRPVTPPAPAPTDGATSLDRLVAVTR